MRRKEREVKEPGESFACFSTERGTEESSALSRKAETSGLKWTLTISL